MYDSLRYLRAFLQVMHDGRLSRSKLEELVRRRLRKVLASAYLHVPYYRETMRGVGYDPLRDYCGPEDLARLPVTTKQVVKAGGVAAFAKEGTDLSGCYRDATSGSTGIPLVVYRDSYERAVQIAKWLRALFINGYSVRDKVMSISSPIRLPDGGTAVQRFGPLKRLAVDYLLPPEKMVDLFLDYRPTVLYGNRTHIDLMALELRRRGIQPTGVKLVLGAAEVIRAASRQLCRQVFGTELLEVYGAVEMGMMAHETQAHDGLHLCEDLTYFEFLDEQGEPVPPGKPGRVVVTDLIGDAMPLIRYDLGDLAVFERSESTDGSRQRRITRIIGRDDDHAPLPDGTRRPYHDFYEILHHYEEIVQFRVVQKTRALFHILVVADPSYLLHIENGLMQQLQAAFPTTVRFEIIAVDRIEPDPSGKLRQLVSEVESEA